MQESEIRRIELDLLLEAIYRRYGYDFRSYVKASIARRATQFLADTGYATFSEATGRLLRNPDLFQRLLPYFSISVTELFRDPYFYRALMAHVAPLLRTWPHFKIWHAGCATGEEVFSLAILLKEAQLYQRAMIYATDISDQGIATARAGICSAETIRRGSRNYHQAGGTASLSAYFRARYDAAVFDASLKRRITFATHNLAADSAFGEMQVVICRNVLIYFNQELKERVLRLFAGCLVNGGFLCLGSRESIAFSGIEQTFEVIDTVAKIYKKRGRDAE